MVWSIFFVGVAAGAWAIIFAFIITDHYYSNKDL